MPVKVLTDSTCYIDNKLKKELDIEIISLNVMFEDTNFKEADIDNESFYKMMKDKGIPTSSQPSVDEMYKQMKNITDKGDNLLCVFLSSDMSGTYSTAHMVKNMIYEKDKNAKIEIIDSRSNCMQLGFAAVVGARAAREGKTLEEVKKLVEDNIKRSRFLFIPENLDYLKKGGRIGGASALLGNLLKIIPILTVEDGKTTIFTKVRTQKKAISTMIEKLMDDVNKFGLGEIVIHNINCYNKAKEIANSIKELLNIDVYIYDIGPVIGLHVGPGAIGIAYYTIKDMR